MSGGVLRLSHSLVPFFFDRQVCRLTQEPLLLLLLLGGRAVGRSEEDGLACLCWNLRARSHRYDMEGRGIFVYALAGTLPLGAFPKPARLWQGGVSGDRAGGFRIQKTTIRHGSLRGSRELVGGVGMGRG